MEGLWLFHPVYVMVLGPNLRPHASEAGIPSLSYSKVFFWPFEKFQPLESGSKCSFKVLALHVIEPSSFPSIGPMNISRSTS